MKKRIIKSILAISLVLATIFSFSGCMWIDENDGLWHSNGPNCDDPNFIGMDCNEYGWWYFRNGVIDWNYTGMACNAFGWWYFRNGQLDWNYTGMACNEYGWWYYRNGMLDWNYTGMACNEYGWWYYQNGRLDWNYTGMAWNENGWWYYQNGRLDWNYTGMACNEWGWWYYQDGHIVWDYTGWGYNIYGAWLYQNGMLNFNYTGVYGGFNVVNGHRESSALVEYARQFVGNPYKFGGTSLTDGCDASGFVYSVFKQFGVDYGRMSSDGFLSVGEEVKLENIQAGDVVVYSGHIGIYDGEGKIIEAQSAKAGITNNREVDCKPIMGIRRLM